MTKAIGNLPLSQKQQEWDLFFLYMALNYSSKSKDPSTQTGAVITKDNRPLGWGYNGLSKRIDDTNERMILENREEKYKRILHAELNAILRSIKTGWEGESTVYITHPPCVSCLHVLSQVDVTRVVSIEPTDDFKSRWNPEETEAEADVLSMSNVIYPRSRVYDYIKKKHQFIENKLLGI